PYDTRSLRMVQTGGGPPPAAGWHAFRDKIGLPLLQGYGCSEAASAAAVMPVQGPDRPGAGGRGVPDQRPRVADEQGRDVPAGEEGEVVVRGPNVFRGYYGLAQETRAALRGGWLHTGDLGRLHADGLLYITGRKKSVINVGG